MNAEEHEAWVKAAKEKLEGSSVMGPGRHVWDRLAMLLGPAELVWLDGEVSYEDFRVSGRVLAFTADVLAVITLVREHPERGGFQPGVDGGRTDVVLVPRRALCRIDVVADEHHPGQNSSRAWERVTQSGERNDAWPWCSPIKLVYEGNVEVTVNGRLRDTRGEDMSDFIFTLVRDLSR